MPRQIIALKNLDRRPPEAGRIRLGEKSGRAMRSIDTFRFTSPHKDALDQLAMDYGGTVKPWSDPKANKNQYELKSEAKTIEVIVDRSGLSINYELWGGGGCQRRCDGEECQVASKDPNEMYDYVPCICAAKGVAECKPYTRLNVVIPTVDFYGVWRMESKGWNVAKELPGMFDMVTQLHEQGSMVRAYLHLEQRTSVAGGQTRHFVVPTMSIKATPNQLISGHGVREISQGGSVPALEPGVDPSADDYPSEAEVLDTIHPPEPEVVEAQVVDEDLEAELELKIRSIAEQHGLDPEAVVATIWAQAEGDYDKLGKFIDRNASGRTLAWTQRGTLKWT